MTEKKSMLCPNCRRLISQDEPVCPYCGMRPFDFVINGLSYIMKKPRPFCFLNIQSQFRRNDTGYKSNFK